MNREKVMPVGDHWDCFLAHQLHVYSWSIECYKCHHVLELGSNVGTDAEAPKHPDQCPGCGVIYGDNYHKSGNPFYLRDDTAEIFTGHPPGMMVHSPWWNDRDRGPDGKCLLVYIPYYIGGTNVDKKNTGGSIAPEGMPWFIDSIAGNCTVPCKCGESYEKHNRGETPNCKKFDPVDNRAHRCWVRVGEPPNVHVSKEGLTCGAGGGSIQGTNWHGYLRHGVLYEE
jgi:hypothetical protein